MSVVLANKSERELEYVFLRGKSAVLDAITYPGSKLTWSARDQENQKEFP